jgi:hypothetical protein
MNRRSSSPDGYDRGKQDEKAKDVDEPSALEAVQRYEKDREGECHGA